MRHFSTPAASVRYATSSIKPQLAFAMTAQTVLEHLLTLLSDQRIYLPSLNSVARPSNYPTARRNSQGLLVNGKSRLAVLWQCSPRWVGVPQESCRRIYRQ